MYSKKQPVPTEESKKRAIKLCDIALAGKVLYRQSTEYGQLLDEVVLANPDKQEGYYIYLKLTSLKGCNRIYQRGTYITALDASELLASLGNGDYSEYEEIPIEHPDAQRILRIYHHLCEIYSIRGAREVFVTKQALLPPPSASDGDTAIQYA